MRQSDGRTTGGEEKTETDGGRDGGIHIETTVVVPAETPSIVLPGRVVHINRENSAGRDPLSSTLIIHACTHAHTSSHNILHCNDHGYSELLLGEC